MILLTNARIRTMDPARPWAEALAIRDGRILAVGRAGDMPGGAAQVIDAGGRLVLPGFQDAHIHLLSGGTDLATAADLFDSPGVEDLTARLAAHAARYPGPLVIGTGWQPGLFGEHNLTAAVLDAALPDRPAIVYDSSFHNACLNGRALELAGIGPDTPDPPNGHLVRRNGRPTGMLHEDAIPWALDRLPGLTDDDYMAGLMAGQAHANAHGITGVLDPKITALEARIYARAAAEDRLTLRVAGAALVTPQDTPATALARLTALRAAHRGPDFHVHSAKVFMDGVFENRTAALIAPYADPPGGNAGPMFGPHKTRNLFTALDAARFQIHVHVIGDAAAEQTLAALEAAAETNGSWPALHQLAHLQLTAPSHPRRLAGLGAMANIQPLWARLDPAIPDIALEMIGPQRLPRTYAFRDFLQQGAAWCLSSDWPVSTLNPFEIIETAVTRQARLADRPRPPFLPEQALTVEEAVMGYTTHAAAACWRGHHTGMLRPGHSADLILLDRDILACPAPEISGTKVALTLFKGHPVHRAPEF